MRSTIDFRHTNQSERNGFTIVELLIVIVVIGILAAITIVAYNNTQQRAQSAAVTKGFRSIDKALQMLANEQGRSTWWRDDDPALTGVANPLISDIITTTSLKNYLQQAPAVSGLGTAYWWYDNDGDAYDPAACVRGTEGINIVFTNVSQTVAQMVDNTLDDGNVACGKVRYNTGNGNRIFYLISPQQSL